MDNLLIAIYVILGGAVLTGLVFFLSQVQMKGWLKQLDLFLDKKLNEYFNAKKESNEREKK
jgi:hypothetical protein